MHFRLLVYFKTEDTSTFTASLDSFQTIESILKPIFLGDNIAQGKDFQTIESILKHSGRYSNDVLFKFHHESILKLACALSQSYRTGISRLLSLFKPDKIMASKNRVLIFPDY